MESELQAQAYGSAQSQLQQMEVHYTKKVKLLNLQIMRTVTQLNRDQKREVEEYLRRTLTRELGASTVQKLIDKIAEAANGGSNMDELLAPIEFQMPSGGHHLQNSPSGEQGTSSHTRTRREGSARTREYEQQRRGTTSSTSTRKPTRDKTSPSTRDGKTGTSRPARDQGASPHSHQDTLTLDPSGNKRAPLWFQLEEHAALSFPSLVRRQKARREQAGKLNHTLLHGDTREIPLISEHMSRPQTAQILKEVVQEKNLEVPSTLEPSHPRGDTKNGIRLVQGRSDPLSNFYPCPVDYQGFRFRTREHAIQYTKLHTCGMRDNKIDWYFTSDKGLQTLKHITRRNNLDLRDPGHFKSAVDAVLHKERRPTNEWYETRLLTARDVMLSAAFTSGSLRTALLDSNVDFFVHDTRDPYWGGEANMHGHLLNHVRRILTSVISHLPHYGSIDVFGPHTDILPAKIRRALHASHHANNTGINRSPRQEDPHYTPADFQPPTHNLNRRMLSRHAPPPALGSTRPWFSLTQEQYQAAKRAHELDPWQYPKPRRSEFSSDFTLRDEYRASDEEEEMEWREPPRRKQGRDNSSTESSSIQSDLSSPNRFDALPVQEPVEDWESSTTAYPSSGSTSERTSDSTDSPPESPPQQGRERPAQPTKASSSTQTSPRKTRDQGLKKPEEEPLPQRNKRKTPSDTSTPTEGVMVLKGAEKPSKRPAPSEGVVVLKGPRNTDRAPKAGQAQTTTKPTTPPSASTLQGAETPTRPHQQPRPANIPTTNPAPEEGVVVLKGPKETPKRPRNKESSGDSPPAKRPAESETSTTVKMETEEATKQITTIPESPPPYTVDTPPSSTGITTIPETDPSEEEGGNGEAAQASPPGSPILMSTPEPQVHEDTPPTGTGAHVGSLISQYEGKTQQADPATRYRLPRVSVKLTRTPKTAEPTINIPQGGKPIQRYKRAYAYAGTVNTQVQTLIISDLSLKDVKKVPEGCQLVIIEELTPESLNARVTQIHKDFGPTHHVKQVIINVGYQTTRNIKTAEALRVGDNRPAMTEALTTLRKHYPKAFITTLASQAPPSWCPPSITTKFNAEVLKPATVDSKTNYRQRVELQLLKNQDGILYSKDPAKAIASILATGGYTVDPQSKN